MPAVFDFPPVYMNPASGGVFLCPDHQIFFKNPQNYTNSLMRSGFADSIIELVKT
jgi:hypothetical protein